MSYYFHTVPKNIALMMKDKYSLNTFVETGTYTGVTAKWAADRFFQVHTVESQKEYYDIAERNLLTLSNVVLYLNDSRNALPEIMNNVGNYGTLFYLDAHWSEGANYGRPLIDSPVIEEVIIINQWENKNHVIIVDDAHRFGTKNWPTKYGIILALEDKGKRIVRELLDVFIAVPNPSLFTLKRSYRDTYASFDVTSTEILSLGRIGN